MSTVALARPGTAAASIATFGQITIHTQQVEIQIQNRLNEITGEAHQTPNFQHGGMTYVSFTCSGYVVSGSPIGLVNLRDPANNAQVATTFRMGSVSGGPGDRLITGNAVLTSVKIAYGRNTPHVQVAVSGVFSNTTNGVSET